MMALPSSLQQISPMTYTYSVSAGNISVGRHAKIFGLPSW